MTELINGSCLDEYLVSSNTEELESITTSLVMSLLSYKAKSPLNFSVTNSSSKLNDIIKNCKVKG